VENYREIRNRNARHRHHIHVCGVAIIVLGERMSTILLIIIPTALIMAHLVVDGWEKQREQRKEEQRLIYEEQRK